MYEMEGASQVPLRCQSDCSETVPQNPPPDLTHLASTGSPALTYSWSFLPERLVILATPYGPGFPASACSEVTF
jgi:hypothetical protein